MTVRYHPENSATMEYQGDGKDIVSGFDSFVDSIDRQLVTLRIGNETLPDGGNDGPAFAYRPSNVVEHMHRAPRGIRHTNRLATLLEETSTGDNDYVDGLKFFVGFFIITPFVIWIVLLLVLKLKYLYLNKTKGRESGKESKTEEDRIPTPKTITSDDPDSKAPTVKSKDQTSKLIIPATPWIAGGGVINMIELSKAGVSRKERKKLVLWSWKLQSIFLTVSLMIPFLSILLMERGWKPLEIAIQEIQELNEDVETLAYRGWNAIDGLQSSKEKLFTNNELIQSILEYSYANKNEPGRKSFERDENNRGHNDHGDFVGHNRRAQFFQPEKATNAPTLPITSDFDWHFPPPLSQFATPTPTDSYKMNAPWKEESQLQGNSVEKMNNNNIGTSNTMFDSKREEHGKNGPYETSTSTASAPTRGIFIEEWCPDAVRFIGAEELNYWTNSIDSLTEKTKAINQIFNSLEVSFPSIESSMPNKNEGIFPIDGSPMMEHSSAFRFVTDTTNYIDESIEWFFANDWLLKLFVLVLNVVNGLLLAVVYFFSKNDVIHQPTRLYVTFVLVPLFFVALICIVIVTGISAVAAMVNSDFCSGGSGIGGPQGTVEDAIMTLQQEKDGVMSNGVLNLAYDAIDYYWTGCLTENPLGFLEDFSDEIDDALARVNEFSLLLQVSETAPITTGATSLLEQTAQEGSSSKTTMSLLNKACKRDMSFLPYAVEDLKSQVMQIRTHIHKLSDTVSCGQVSPLLRRVSHGAMCVESPQGLTVVWAASFGIAILCFVMFTVRAALYNSVKYKKRRPMKPRRIVEKEFQEYKEFMSEYYGEKITSEWKIDGIPLPPTKLQFEFDKDIELKGTFETAKSSEESVDDGQEDAGSENAGIFAHNLEVDESSYGSSYDSECSDDEKSIDSANDDEQSSAIGSIFSEAKSIAVQTLHSLRNVKSLLSGSTKASNNFPSHIGSSTLHIGDRNVDESDEEEIPGRENDMFFSQKPDINGVATGGTIDDDESESIANSISDASLYLTTPKNAAPPSAVMIKKKRILSLSGRDDFCDEDEVDDANDKILANHSLAISKQSWTPTSLISALSPKAPMKSLPFLARTLYTGEGFDENHTEEELSSLVQPIQLANHNSFQPNTRRGTARRGQREPSIKRKYSSR